VGEDGKTTKSLVTHTTTEVYYSTDQPVYGQAGGSQLELPTGKYVFPFRATIPPNAPTSFNGAHGQIKHEVTLTIDRAVRYNNTFKQCFTVILPHDLNRRLEYKVCSLGCSSKLNNLMKRTSLRNPSNAWSRRASGGAPFSVPTSR